MRTLLSFKLISVAGKCKKIFFLVSNCNLHLFFTQVVAIKTDESVAIVHRVRMNKQEANLVAQTLTL